MFGARTLLFLGMLAIATAIDPNNICVLVKDGTKIVDDTSCSSYYTCNGGKATAVACQSGYSFDKDAKGCMPSSQVTCGNVVLNPCAGVEDKKFVSNPESCRAYFYCLNGAVSHSGNCPGDFYFDEKTQLCDYKSNVACSATGGTESSDNPNFLCAYIPNGMFFGSASDCKLWSKCTNDVIRHGECSGSLVFNVQTGACDYPSNYDCQQLEGDAGETGTTTQCSVPNAIKQNDKSCSGYLKCLNNEWVAVNCASGLYYEPSTGFCKSRNEAVTYAGCNRCEGTTLNFANLVGDGCVGYMRCKNGVQGTEDACDKGYFFNENFGHCVNENPAFRVCLKECTECDSTVTTTVNSCNADCNAVTCDCTCTSCAEPGTPTCSSCLASDTTQINKCNTPTCESDFSCDCDCKTCEDILASCSACASDDFTQINVCNTPLCEDDKSCQCTCAECDVVPLPECDVATCESGGGGYDNRCNSGCNADGTCECTCLSCNDALSVCDPETCNNDASEVSNKCNSDCEETDNCGCTCDECTTVLSACDLETCTRDAASANNRCSSACEDTDNCECTCERCDNLNVCAVGECIDDDTLPLNICNDPDCEEEEGCECFCRTCEG